MPQHDSCKKRMRTSAKANTRNRAIRSQVKTAAKKVREAGDAETANAALQTAYSVLDKAVKRNVIHRNKAANQKSKLTAVAAKVSA